MYLALIHHQAQIGPAGIKFYVQELHNFFLKSKSEQFGSTGRHLKCHKKWSATQAVQNPFLYSSHRGSNPKAGKIHFPLKRWYVAIQV